jgi:hypothetical protein
MQNLADAVLDYYFFLYFADEGKVDAERSVRLVELFNQIENNFSEEEKQQLKEAAVRRFQKQEEIIENGGIPQFPTASAESLFLGNIAEGYFDIPALDDIRDPDEDMSQYDE